MIHDSVIKTDADARVNIAVAGNYSSKKGGIIQGRNHERKKTPWYISWWMIYIIYAKVLGSH